MSVQKIQVLQPGYYEKFSCIGGACEDVCCRDWNIVIDKNTYDRCRSIKDKRFVEKFLSSVKRNKGVDANTVNYAKFIMREDGFCNFIRDDGLCEIHGNHGAKYLGNVCMTYPRKCCMMQQGLHEFSLVMSCPEVIRVALFRPEIMTFKLTEIPFDASNRLLRLRNQLKTDYEKTARFTPYSFKIRESCIDILQCRTIRLPDRILAIGMMLSKLTGLESVEKEDLEKLVGTYVSAAIAGIFNNALADTADNAEVAADMKGVLLLMAGKFTEYGRIGRVNKLLFDAMSDHVPESGELPFVAMHEKLEEFVPKYWTPFLEQKGYILEHYFVNLVFSTMFPFKYGEDIDIYQHFIILAEQYAMMRMIFCVCAEKQNGITDELIISVLNGMAMYSEHSKKAKDIAEIYVKNGFDSLAYMSFLLK